MTRTVKAELLSPAFARRELRVTIERSFGTFTGWDAEISSIKRMIEYRMHQWLEARKLQGRWTLVVYVGCEKT